MSSIERVSVGRTCWTLILATLAVASGAQAAEQFYVLPDGRKVALQKSETEFAVTMRQGVDLAAGARRLASQGRGVIKDVPTAAHSRYKLLQVADTAGQRRELVRQDPAIEAVRPVYRFSGSDSPMMCSGTLVARVRRDTNPAERAELWRQYRLRELRPVGGVSDTFVLEPIDDDGEAVDVAALLAVDSRVRWSQPNFRSVRQPRQVTPSDQFYSRQWHLNNTGQLGGTQDADIDAPEAWLVAEGQDVLFGMFDDSCDVEHEDLRDRYKGNGQDPSLQFNDPDYDNPSPKQIFDRHGTAVMGLAVASANSLGVRGVAYLGRFTASRGLNELLTDEEVASVYTFARQEDVDVHINSWGALVPRPNAAVIEEAIRVAFREGRPLGDNNLGMVIVFAAGNSGVENVPGFDYSTMPEVIGVAASNDDDELASYSNYGPNINVLAPSADDFHGAMATTDNTDSGDFVEDGYNIGGFDEFGFPDLDNRGLYTGTFGGTSAACPVAAGVAGLVVSRNTLLTATDVRLILEHTCDQVNIAVADYNGITSRSPKYGYGRLNAKGAVDAASDSLTNGNRTWPDRPSGVAVTAGTLAWKAGVGSEEFLVVESTSPFGFIPLDGACYHQQQLGCGSVTLTALPNGVTALAPVSCNGACDLGEDQSAAFLLPGGKKYFGLYARSAIGRYSFGVSVDSEGNIIDGGPTVEDGGGNGGGTGGGGDVIEPEPPRVSINVSPLEGVSPLTVQFSGNAVSSRPIDQTSIAWDFDVGAGESIDADERTVSYTYVVPEGEKTFIARLSMKDEDGRAGTAQVQIRVRAGTSDESGGGGSSDVRIIVGVPGNIDADLDEGTSPFEVELKVDASSLAGTFVSVVWDLGDGTRASSQVVPHTYINTSGQPQVFPVTAIVTTALGAATIQVPATRLITVQSGTLPVDKPEVVLPGAGANGEGGRAGCSAIGLIPMLAMLSGLCLLRRRSS